MNKYKFIMQNLKAGFRQPVKNEDGFYLIIISDKDRHGNYRTSLWYDTLEECKEYIGSGYGYSNLEKQCQDWEILEPYFPIQEEALPVGSFVKVKDDAEEICGKYNYNWYKTIKEMIGKVYKIEESNLKGVSINDWWFPLQAITPVMEEEEEDEKKALETLKKKGWKIKGECLVK